MARLWEIREDYDYRHGEYEVEKAYKEGCMHGYKKALREFESMDHRGYREEDDDYMEYRRGGRMRR